MTAPGEAILGAQLDRLARNGKAAAELVRGTSLVVPKARSKRAWVVYAVATPGNVSRPPAALRMR